MVACLLGFWIRIPPRHGCLSLVSVVFCYVGNSAFSRSLVQSSSTECSVYEFYHEALIMTFRPTRGYRVTKGEKKFRGNEVKSVN